MSDLELPQRCPFADCGQDFAVPARRHGNAVVCPGCGRALTAMDPAAVRRREAEHLRRALARRTAGATGGPGGADGPPVGDPGLVGLLENVRSLWNVGSMFRTADGCGMGRIVLTGITGCPPRPEISKTALGAEDWVEWEYDPEPRQAARRLRAAGYRLLALETGCGGARLEEVDSRGPLCLIVGHEVAGISADLLEMADQRLEIGMRGVKESLNVAVAFGIAAYHVAGARERAGAGRAAPSPSR